ncbi:autotransporter outer membrane beta-barrel domain-containing protein [Campylobacter coli]|nr:autotransporter outer membrane beta-barrel domain-containing protein [Campylobacter coli]
MGQCFNGFLNSFSDHLYDLNGVKAQIGMRIVKTQAEVEEAKLKGETVFLVKDDGVYINGSFSNASGNVYFKGENVAEVIKNAKLGYDGVNGIPINAWEGIILDMSHIELDNSLMSHQSWRNYNFYMEAELALLQDIGYNFDRKLYYGDSIYESNLLNWQSDHGYYARKDGKWLIGEYNPTEYGVSLHIYGKNNIATQSHDILSSGVAASGIRIDGSNNQLIIANDTKVHTLGDYSNALLIAYGKDHVIEHNGELKATGKEGIAINIDFGDNTLGNAEEYRGSYIHQMSGNNQDDLAEYNLDGALVKSLNLNAASSTIGSLASIYIADNAYVNTINIAQWAKVEGDIISNWDPNNEKLANQYKDSFYTDLNFGSDSSLSRAAFNSLDNTWSVKANVLGYDNFKMNANENLNLQGSAFVYDLNNKAHFSLLGADGINPSLLYIKNNFTQDSNAILTAGINANGQSLVYVGGNANLAGAFNFYMLKDFYKDKVVLDPDLISANQIQGAFNSIVYDSSLDFSPTLNFIYDANTKELGVVRDYTPYIKNSSDISLAYALNSLAQNGKYEDIALLFKELDFATDAQTIAQGLNELNAKAYLDSAKISLDFQEELNKEALSEYANEWQSFVTPFGTYQSSRANGDFDAYKGYGGGVKAKAIKGFDSFNLGFNLVLNTNNIDIDDTLANTKTTGAYAGIFSKYDLEDFYLLGSFRMGYEHTKLNRNVNIGAFSANYNSKFNSYLISEMVGIGKSFNHYGVSYGPLAYIEHSFLYHFAINEENQNSTALNIDSKNFHALNSFMGFNVNYEKGMSDKAIVNFYFLGGWNHYFLDSLKNNASFKDASLNKFYTKSKLSNQDSLYLQGEIDFTHNQSFFTRLMLSSDIKDNIDFSTKLEVGAKF